MGNNWPKISVITPSFNQEEFLEETILSVLNQNYPNLEYIIIDGGSTDSSVDIIKKYKDKIDFWISEIDTGQSNAINKGFSKATGDIVAWLNSDDLYIEDTFWHIAELYKKNPDVDLIIGNGYRYGWPSKTLQRFSPRHIAFNLEALTHGLDYILQPSTFFSKEVLTEVGFLDEHLNFAMDWELWFKIGSNGKVVVTDKPLSLSREYSDTKTAAGGFRRWEEIRNLGQKMTGEECTPGALFFFTETLNAYLVKNQDKESYKLENFAPIEHMWLLARQLLTKSVGTSDGFPLENTSNVVHYLPYVDSLINSNEIYNLGFFPKISIITPSFNQGVFIEKTILSIIGQNYPNLEYIIIDGGSTDKTIDIIKKYEDRLDYWVSEKDNGPAEAINKGFNKATGDIICWVNSDDCLSSHSLWEVALAFNQNPNIQTVYGHAIYIDENDKAILMDHGYQKTKIYYGYQQSFDKTIEYWNTVYMIPQPTVFWKRELLDKYGFPNENYKYIFDYEYFLRFTKDGNHFHLIDRVQAFYRIHNMSKTSGFESFYPELYQYSRINWSSPFFYKSFIKYFAKKIKPFYSRDFIGKIRYITRMLWTSIQITTKIGNPENHFVKLVGRQSK